MTLKKPVIFVVGATGAGKSKLALEVATECGATYARGEIVNADSMQIRRGLPIATNKATPEEHAVAPHHLLGIADATEPFTVLDFQRRCLECMDAVHARGNVPIVVGGTHYYIESILWPDRVVGTPGDVSCLDVGRELTDMTKEELYHELMRVDPKMAQKLHPNDFRKVTRSLEIFRQSNVPHSKLIEQQTQAGNSDGPTSRFRCMILVVNCDVEVLNRRLDTRVDKMLDGGLMAELKTFRDAQASSLDFKKGLAQNIGLKEFEEYFQSENKREPERCAIHGACVQKMKQATRRYARSQEKWIAKRLMPKVRLHDWLWSFNVDSSNAEGWDEVTKKPALAQVQLFLDGKLTQEKQKNGDFKSSVEWRKFDCEVCNKQLNGPHEYEVHLASRAHRRRKKRTLGRADNVNNS